MKRRKNIRNLKPAKDFPTGFLTEREVEVIGRQIRANSIAMDRYIEIIDLLVNKEKCPKDANTLLRLRRCLEVAVAENDTFRRVLWRHMQLVESKNLFHDDLDASSFLIQQIKFRRNAVIAQTARK